MKTLAITTMSERIFKNEIITDNPLEVGYPSKELGNVEKATTIDDCLVLLPFEGELIRFKYDKVTVNGSGFSDVYLLLKELKTIGYAQFYNASGGNGNSGFSIPSEADYCSQSNLDSNGNYQTVIYRSGGAGGIILMELSIVYDDSGEPIEIFKL
jgi:hypothetical protein